MSIGLLVLKILMEQHTPQKTPIIGGGRPAYLDFKQDRSRHDITQFTNQGGGYMSLVVFGTFFWMQAISERLYGPSMPKIYFWKA